MNQSLQCILVVEDDPTIRKLLRLVLQERDGFTVLICPSAEDVRAQILTFAPDLLLFDVQLPDLDGPALLDQLRHAPFLIATPAIFLTATPELLDGWNLDERGVLGVLRKPIEPSRLPIQLRALWNHKTG